MTYILDHTTFGASKGCMVLADKLNQAGDEWLSKKVANIFARYFVGLNDIQRMKSSTRNEVLMMWFDKYKRMALEQLGPKFDEYGIELSYFDNILKYRREQAMLHGGILEKLNPKNHKPDRRLLDHLEHLEPGLQRVSALISDLDLWPPDS